MSDRAIAQSRIISTDDADLIRRAAPEDIVVLYRGCSKADAQRMRDAMTAGGAPVDDHCGEPATSPLAVGAGESGPQAPVEAPVQAPARHRPFVEFAHRPDHLMTPRGGAAPGGAMGVAQVWIRRRYLAGGEDHWRARHEAPIERWAFKTLAPCLGGDGPSHEKPSTAFEDLVAP